MLTDLLMIRIESRKILLIKEMAEGAVSGIMEEPGQAKEFIYIGKRGEFCFFPFDPVGHHNVMINRVGDQSGPLSVLCLFHVPETFFHESLSESSLPFSLPPGCLNFTFPAPTSRRAITMGRLSASTNGLAPFMIIFALMAARITSSKRLSTFLRQSSTVILAIFFLPLSLIFFEDQMLTPSTPFCKDDRL